MKKLIFMIFLLTNIFAKEYIINLKGDVTKENQSFKINLNVDEDGKPIPKQKYDIRNLDKIKSLKLLSAPGLLGTLKDERELIVYYKTNLNINGMKIRNLYKVGVKRVYGEENNITINFDPDYYQNIISFLRYHNIKQETIKDIDNLYGTWEEIE